MMTLEQLVAIEGYADEHGYVTDQMLTLLIDFANAHLTNPPEIPDSSAQPQPVAHGEVIGVIEACNRLDLLLDAYEHAETGDTLHDKDWLVRDFINDTRVWEVFEALYTIPTGHRVVPVDEVAWQMLDAGMAAWKESATHEVPHQSGTAVVKSDTRHRLKVAFKAMLAAAPDAGGV